MLAAPSVRKIKSASRGHEHARAPSTFLDVLSAFARQVDRFAADHYFRDRATRRIPLEDGIRAVIEISHKTVQ
jgi:hypothetical protein